MFDRDIVSSDSFTEMSSDAQSLYFHLGIQADDEGFVSPKGIMRMISAPEDSLKVLIGKKFVIPFQSGVVVITDWNKNNWLDTRRLHRSVYTKERKLLSISDDGKYSLSEGLASAKQMRVESSIEESRVEEKRDIATNVAEEFSFKEEIRILEDSSRRDLNIIAMYFEEKKPDIRNKAQLSVAIRRHLRGAKQLCPFTDTQILDALPKAKKSTPDFTLETLVKMLTK